MLLYLKSIKTSYPLQQWHFGLGCVVGGRGTVVQTFQALASIPDLPTQCWRQVPPSPPSSDNQNCLQALPAIWQEKRDSRVRTTLLSLRIHSQPCKHSLQQSSLWRWFPPEQLECAKLLNCILKRTEAHACYLGFWVVSSFAYFGVSVDTASLQVRGI